MPENVTVYTLLTFALSYAGATLCKELDMPQITRDVFAYVCEFVPSKAQKVGLHCSPSWSSSRLAASSTRSSTPSCW